MKLYFFYDLKKLIFIPRIKLLLYVTISKVKSHFVLVVAEVK